jgi:hypothetical protein
MQIAKKTVGEKGITFNWADESTDFIKFEYFDEVIMQHAAAHGISQKLGDSYAGAKTVAEAKAAFYAVLESLKGGDWNRKGGAQGGVWVEAIAKATGQSFDDVLEKWTAMDEETRKAVKGHPDVIEAKAQIDLEKAQAKAKATKKGEDYEPLTL